MVKQVDTQDLKSCGRKSVRVRFPLLVLVTPKKALALRWGKGFLFLATSLGGPLAVILAQRDYGLFNEPEDL